MNEKLSFKIYYFFCHTWTREWTYPKNPFSTSEVEHSEVVILEARIEKMLMMTALRGKSTLPHV